MVILTGLTRLTGSGKRGLNISFPSPASIVQTHITCVLSPPCDFLLTPSRVTMLTLLSVLNLRLYNNVS